MNTEHLHPSPYPAPSYRPRAAHEESKIWWASSEIHALIKGKMGEYFILLGAFPILFLLNHLWHLLVLEAIVVVFLVLIPPNYYFVSLDRGKKWLLQGPIADWGLKQMYIDENVGRQRSKDHLDVKEKAGSKVKEDLNCKGQNNDDAAQCENADHNKNKKNTLPSMSSSPLRVDDKMNLSSHRFSSDIKLMMRHFLDMVESEPAVALWETAYTSKEVVIYNHRSLENCYRIHGILENTPETCFELMADATERPKYDDMCEEARVVEVIDDFTKIVYVKMKAIWPTAARDCVLLSHIRRLSDGRLLNVTKSVAHPDCPDLENDGIIRMVAGIAGQVCMETEGDGQVPSFCKFVQIVDGDLKGWIPKSVISFIAKKGLPNSLRKLNEILLTMDPVSESTLLPSSLSTSEQKRDSAVTISHTEDDLLDIMETSSDQAAEDKVDAEEDEEDYGVEGVGAGVSQVAVVAGRKREKDSSILTALKKLQDRIAFLETLIKSKLAVILYQNLRHFRRSIK